MLFRVLNVRKHKSIVFIDSFTDNFQKIQLKISRELFDLNNLQKGDVINVDVVDDINKNGDTVYKIININKIMRPHNNSNYTKSINDDDNYKKSLNGGETLKQWEFRNILLEEISKYLVSNDFIRVITSNIMDKRGTSIATPVKLNGKYVNNKYLKITHELELKKQVYLTLKSLFEIGYVTRDIYSTEKNNSEYLNLELVSKDIDYNIIIKFYEFVNQISIKIAKDLNIEYGKFLNNIEIIDVLKEYNKTGKIITYNDYNSLFKELREKHQNCIFVNSPTDTPLAKKNSLNFPLEIKWVINNSGVGHGYEDETDINVLLNLFNEQKQKLNEKNIDAELQDDYLQVLMDAGIDTMSLNLGIDRYINKVINGKNIKKTYKILGI